MNKSLTDLWREYRDLVYPTQLPADQNRELHKAFMAGCFVILQEVVKVTKCEETDSAEAAAAGHIASLLREATEWHRLRIEAGRNRN